MWAPLYLKLICHGQLCGVASVPPTILGPEGEAEDHFSVKPSIRGGMAGLPQVAITDGLTVVLGPFGTFGAFGAVAVEGGNNMDWRLDKPDKPDRPEE